MQKYATKILPDDVIIVNTFDAHFKVHPNQKLHMKDFPASEISLDKVTCFSLRPPLLPFVRKMKDYFSHIIITRKVDPEALNQQLSKTPQPWIDGTCSIVKIRLNSVSFMNDLITSKKRTVVQITL